MANEITFTVSFVAGLVSFISPCVLPIIPGFLAYLAGSSLKESESQRWQIFLNSLFFVLGFSTVFAVLGVVLQTVLVQFAAEVQLWLSRIGGGLIIFFGLYLMHLIRIPFLEQEHKLAVDKSKKSSLATSFLFGAAFAAGWTPCVGAVLGGILGLAAAMPGSAFGLLVAYSLGLGLPFILVGLFASQAQKFFSKYSGWLNYVQIGFGVILILLGILVFTQRLDLIANFDLVNQWVMGG